ncbi:LRP4 [Mytilus coruscus]|uniref:LRP4 n=1 Tax=Mytilus coruscus TaxID=42192 RepID=A0A6J8EWA0_MYTCO|nr:LRP4 [Mytilus coruscus]
MFDDGRIVLTDESTKGLAIMNQEGELIKTIALEDECFDIAVIDKNTVATTLVMERKIVIVDVNSSRVQRSIRTKDECYGIISTGQQLVVSLWNKTIQFFDLSGNALSTLSTDDISLHCSVLNGKLYYTTHYSDAVYSTDLNGEDDWKFDFQKSVYPTGITHDAAGNIFVACRDSNNLMVIRPSGKKSRTILTEEDGLQKPRAINYNRKTNTLLVCNLSGQCFLYKVTN